MVKKAAIFIDRDGVINKKMPEGEYVKSWDEFYFLPGVFKAFKLLNSSPYLIIIITNQRCVARGIITQKELNAIHKKMKQEIKKTGGRIDALYACPHNKNACPCRKPRPGMILQAISDFKKKGIYIDVKKSYFIDDNPKDIAMGKNIGAKAIKIGKPSAHAPFTANSLLESIYLIDNIKI